MTPLADLSSWPRLLATGPAFLGLLHRLSTGDVAGLSPGEGRPTVVTTPKGRILARLVVLHLGGDGVLALAGPGSGERVLAHLAKYALGEDIGLRDASAEIAAFAVLGPGWERIAAALGVSEPAPYAVARAGAGGWPVARTNGFDAEGLLVLPPAHDAAGARAALERAGGTWLSEPELEAWRVGSLRPLAGRELTEDYNPLEAGLGDAVSFTKGCYVGQEVVARLNTYDKVARSIVGLAVAGPAVPPRGARLLAGEREIGTVTSAVAPSPAGAVSALAYVKRRDLPAEGAELTVAWDGARAPARIVTR